MGLTIAGVGGSAAWFEAARKHRDGTGMHLSHEAVARGEGKNELWMEQEALMRVESMGIGMDEALMRLIEENPQNYWPGLLLARRLLQRGEEGRVRPLLERLEAMGCAEAAFFCGVAANRRGDLEQGLFYFRRAQELNPNHADTQEQVRRLEEALQGA